MKKLTVLYLLVCILAFAIEPKGSGMIFYLLLTLNLANVVRLANKYFNA